MKFWSLRKVAFIVKIRSHAVLLNNVSVLKKAVHFDKPECKLVLLLLKLLLLLLLLLERFLFNWFIFLELQDGLDPKRSPKKSHCRLLKQGVLQVR